MRRESTPRPISAITDDGDAVYLPLGGTALVRIFDGPTADELESPSPDRLQQRVDAITVSPNEQFGYVGFCCEPITGLSLRADLTQDPALNGDSPVVPGYAPTINETGALLAVGIIDSDPLSVLDLASGTLLESDFEGDVSFSPYDLVWLDEHHVVTIGIRTGTDANEDPTAFVVFGARVEAGRVVFGTPATVAPFVPENFDDFRFAGTLKDGSVGIHTSGSDAVLTVAFASSMDATVRPPIDLAGPVRSVWLDPEQPDMTVTADGELTVGDVSFGLGFQRAQRR